MEKLKRCPFCGGNAQRTDRLDEDDNITHSTVRCKPCGLTMAFKKWQARAEVEAAYKAGFDFVRETLPMREASQPDESIEEELFRHIRTALGLTLDFTKFDTPPMEVIKLLMDNIRPYLRQPEREASQPVDSAWEDVHLRVYKDDQYKGPGPRCISYQGIIYYPERESVDLAVGGNAIDVYMGMHRAADYNDGEDIAKACAEAWGLQWRKSPEERV